MSRLIIIIGVVCGVLVAACKPSTPNQYIQPEAMEDILVDYHIARAMVQVDGKSAMEEREYLDAVLKKHGVSREDFDSSLVYYYIRAERFATIYGHVKARLDEKALALGATEGEIGKYASLASTGDTANVWRETNTLTLLPMPPYNRFDFTLEPDSTFLPGDDLLMQFMVDFVYQDGTKDGTLYLVAEYPDTIITSQQYFSYSGLIQSRIEGKSKHAPTHIGGFFYLGGGNAPTTTLKMLFVNSIQLIRFHKKQVDEQPKMPTDSIAHTSDSLGRTPDSTSSRTGGGDSVKALPAQRRIAKDIVATSPSVSTIQP